MSLEDTHEYRHPWMGVEVRHLATLIAVARTGSFRQAASELGYVQSAVSQQISSLEQVVGTRLVDRRRGHRIVTLTPAGELLLERSIGIVAELRAARVDVSVTEDHRGPVVRLAIATDVAPRILERLLPEVMEAMPGIRLRVTETGSEEELVARLEQGVADLAIGTGCSGGTLASATLLHDPFVVLAAPTSPLASTRVSDVSNLLSEQLIVPTSALADVHLRAAGLRLERALHVPVAAAVAPLVAAGVGIGLVPQSDAVDTLDGVAVVATAGVIPPRRIVLCWQGARRRTALLESFSTLAIAAFERSSPAPAVALLPQAA